MVIKIRVGQAHDKSQKMLICGRLQEPSPAPNICMRLVPLVILHKLSIVAVTIVALIRMTLYQWLEGHIMRTLHEVTPN